MVALRTIFAAAAACAICFASMLSGYAQQPKARLAGLERNDEYMELLRKDAELVRMIDSTTTAVYDMRERLYSDDGSRKERSSDLLELESSLYVLRDDRSRLAEQINRIEQEWLLVNLSAATPVEQSGKAEPDSPTAGRQSADLIKNDYFSRSLSRTDYSMLCRAQEREIEAAKLYSDFVKTHGELAALRAQYDSLASDYSADALYRSLLAKHEECTTLSNSLDEAWNNAFDNKSYLYNLLFDIEDRDDMLDNAEQSIFEMRQSIARESGRHASDAVVAYCFGKRFILDYESEIARTADLSLALDSLTKVGKSLGKLRYDFAKVPLQKRSFIDYRRVVFSTRYVYTSRNPIRQCPVYEYGVVCRIKLGEFSTQQPVTKFRGLEPVSYLRTANGGWVYYAGCYRDLESMENALKTVRRLGFTKADVAAWNDGVYADGRDDVEALMSKRYAVEISGADDLSPEVREAIAADDENTGLTRTGRGVFTVGGLRSRDAADALAAAVSAADATLSVSVVEQ